MAAIGPSATQLFADAKRVLAGGVSASMRVHPYLDRPLYVERGEGPYLVDLDGRRAVDSNLSNGAALLGHNHPRIEAVVLAGVEAGMVTASETVYDEQLADAPCTIIPAAERGRFSTVGSEVTLVALRIARQDMLASRPPTPMRASPKHDRSLNRSAAV